MPCSGRSELLMYTYVLFLIIDIVMGYSILLYACIMTCGDYFQIGEKPAAWSIATILEVSVSRPINLS